MRLRTKYAAVLLAILLVLGTVVFGSAELFKQRTIEQEQQDLDETTRLAADQIDESIRDQVDLIRAYGASEEMNNFSQSEENLNRLVERSTFNIVQLVDRNRTVRDFQGQVNEQQREAIIGRNVSDRTYVQKGLAGQTHVRDPERLGNETVATYNVIISAPVININNEFRGVLAGATQLSTTDFLSPITPLKTSSQSVTVRGQTVNGTLEVLSGTDKEFDNALSSSAKVSTTGWTVEVRRDRGTLTSQLQFLQYIQFGSLFVVLLSVFGLGYYQYRTTLQQTDKLLDGFDELTEGNFEYSLDLTAAEEWNQIGDGFNEMATGLREREQQIREREQQIRERERRLSVLNRVLRHNLQNDMTVIQGYAEILPTAGQEQLEQASEKILQKSRGLVNHGKKARRLETVMENAEEGAVDLDIGKKVLDMAEKYDNEYSEFAVDIDIDERAWASAVSGIEFGIESIIENAFHHNDSDDPEVSVRLEQEDETVLIHVEDNGPGIPEHEREVLTQDEETSLEHGSGIGLWLAYWAVVKSDGGLEFDTPDGDGSIVTIRLPRTEPPEGSDEDESSLDL
jgi:signal transduction histidine kinase